MIDTMKSTMNAAGRIVVPKPLREALGALETYCVLTRLPPTHRV